LTVGPSVELEEVLEERPALSLLVVTFVTPAIVVVIAVTIVVAGFPPLVVAGLPAVLVIAGVAASDWGGGGEGGCRPLDDLV
jgi:hypothetical protein